MSRILIADDKEENLYYLESLLIGHGHTVERARHGAEALVKGRVSPPDLIISDLLMPVMDGYTLLRHCRSDPKLSRIPFIVYTATYTEPEDERLALSLGADAFILKPTEPDEFLLRIGEVLSRGSRPAEGATANPPAGETELLKSYSETLIRKLEEKMLLLEESNRALERDIAEREIARQQIADAQRFNQILIESSPLAIITYRATGDAVTANAASVAMLGAPSLEALKSQNFRRLAFWKETGLLDAASAALASEKPRELEFKSLNSFGGEIWLRCMLVPFTVADDPYLLCFFEDIRERKLAELKLQESEESQRQLAEGQTAVLNALPAQIALVDAKGVIVSVNESWRRFATGNKLRTPGFGVGQNYIAVCDNARGDRALEAAGVAHGIRKVLQGETNGFAMEYPCHSPTEQRWFRLMVTPLREDCRLGAVVMHMDITERRQLEEQIRQAQKMEAIGQLAAGVAHDFNNILASILGNAQLALSDLPTDDPTRDNLEQIQRASVRATSLVQQILAFSRQQPQERRVMNLAPAIQETMRFLRATIPATVQIDVSLDDSALPVLADPTQIHQVLTNLCTNAWHALEDQPGRIEVRLEAITLDVAAADRLAGLKPGQLTCLSVSDNGKGMDGATLERIFDPFFTTKEPGKGTGLGLSVVHGIVQEHDAAITVASHPGRGTIFRLFFPAAVLPAEPSSTPKAMPQRGGGQHILFLDDEEALVLIARRMLERLGYRVTGFTSAAEALQSFRRDPASFDLVITDLNMPGRSGLRVATEMLQERPELPVILCSGHVTEELRRSAHAAGIRAVLYKPSTMEDFSDVIQRFSSAARSP